MGSLDEPPLLPFYARKGMNVQVKERNDEGIVDIFPFNAGSLGGYLA